MADIRETVPEEGLMDYEITDVQQLFADQSDQETAGIDLSHAYLAHRYAYRASLWSDRLDSGYPQTESPRSAQVAGLIAVFSGYLVGPACNDLKNRVVMARIQSLRAKSQEHIALLSDNGNA